MMFCLTAFQLSSIWSRVLPRYLDIATPPTILSPSSPFILNFISPHLAAISTSLRLSHISITFLHLYIRLCLNSLAAGMCILHWSHLGSSSDPSFMIFTFNFQCRYIKFSLSLPGFFHLPYIPLLGTPPTSKSAGTTPCRSPDLLT